MRIVLFSSMVLHVLNYGTYFSRLGHEFIVTPLVPLRGRIEYENQFAHYRGLHKKSWIFPIFLKAPNNRFRNLLNPSILLGDFRSIFKTLKQLDPDAIICFYVLDAYPLILLKRIFDYSLSVVAMGGDVNLHEGLLYTLVRKLVYQYSDSIFAVSNELKDKIKREGGHEATIISTGVDPSFFKPVNSKVNLREKWGLRKEDLVVLTVCNLNRNKGVDVVIKSMSMLKEHQLYQVKLAIAGDGPEKPALEGLASKLGIRKDVIFLGHRSREELLELYNLADLFVLASNAEGLPFSLLEAMACGSICISTGVGGIPGAITEGDNGFLINPGDSVGLARKIEEILSLSEEQISLIRGQARSTVMDNFDFRELTKAMIDIIISRNRQERNNE